VITIQILLGLVSHSQPLWLHCACIELLLKLEYLHFKSVGCICGMAEQMEQWKDSEQYGGQTREVTYRSICHSPMCPPDTAVTVWQHAAFSSDKQTLIFEAVSQIHDVPFGSYFEVHLLALAPTCIITVLHRRYVTKLGQQYMPPPLQSSALTPSRVVCFSIKDVNSFTHCLWHRCMRSGHSQQNQQPVVY
jgi:hypothetical protein